MFYCEFLSPYLCGIGKVLTLNMLFFHILKNERKLSTVRVIGAVLIDLSKAFDTINHELLTAKLYAY